METTKHVQTFCGSLLFPVEERKEEDFQRNPLGRFECLVLVSKDICCLFPMFILILMSLFCALTAGVATQVIPPKLNSEFISEDLPGPKGCLS